MRILRADDDGVLRPADGGEALGRCSAANILAGPVEPQPGLFVVDSGWDDRAPHLAWRPQAWRSTLLRWTALAAASPAAGCTPLLHPRAGHTIGDAQRAATFLREAPAARLALEPAALLTPAMVPDAAEHLDRIAAAIPADRVGLLIASSLSRDGALVPPDAGVIDPALIAALARRLAPPLLAVRGGEASLALFA